jgi:hypothetical protein
LSQSSWLVAGVLPGIERQPRKKLEPSAERLLSLLHRWRDEAVRAGKKITRIALAFEAGRDGFWLARWLSARGVECESLFPPSGESGANLTFDVNLVARRLYVLAPIVGAIIVAIVLTHERSTAAASPAE